MVHASIGGAVVEQAFILHALVHRHAEADAL